MNRVTSIILIALLALTDQITKLLVEYNLPFQESQPFYSYISWYRTYNEGVAFSSLGFLSNKVLIALIFLIILFVIWLWRELEAGRILSHLGFILILSGAIGNLFDRITRGHVVDFIQVHTQNWSFAIFNLADSLITIGATFIIIDEIRLYFSSKQEPDNE